MEFKRIINLIILLAFYVELLESVPSFVDEFVHIKVHVPKDVANTRGILKSTHPGSPQYPYTSHKVVHHYHRRRNPFKKSPAPKSAPLLEGIILTELDKAHAEDTDQSLEETFVVKEVPSEQKVNTFRVIEETVQKKPSHSSYKVYKSSEQYGDHNSYHYQTHDSDGSHHYHHRSPHVESVEIIKSKKSPIHDPHSNHYEHDEIQDYTPNGYHKETIEIIKTKTSPKYHHSSDYGSQVHHDFKPQQKEIIEEDKEIIYKKPAEEYEIHRGKVKPIYSYSSKDLKPVYEEQIEYESPSAIYKGQHEEYRKPSVIYREYENSRYPTSTRTEHAEYGTKKDLDSDYHHASASTDSYHTDDGHSTTKQIHKSYYHPSTQTEAESYRYKTPSSYSGSYDTGVQYVTSPQTAITRDSKSQVFSKSSLPHDGVYDELLPAIVEKPKLSAHIDWPEGVGKPYSTETYSGYDSYSAGHVQGVDSGVFRYSAQR